MKNLRFLTLVFVATLAASSAQAGDPSGSWGWTVTPPNGGSIDISLTLQLQDGELTGTYSSERFGDAPITEASFVDEVVAFSVEREFNGNAFTIKYNGKLDGDAIDGTFELPGFGGGGPVEMEWHAKRSESE
jgi:hypothetical protein